jgi:hypothetical protein
VKKLYLVLGLIFFVSQLQAQFQVRDSVLFNPHISILYGHHSPVADLAKRFGPSGSLGMAFDIKDKKSHYWGAQFQYHFGNKVTEPGLMQNLYTDQGEILDNQGQPSIVYVQQRGWSACLEAGHLFNKLGPNLNSGLLATVGLGYMTHKIRLEHQSHEINALQGDYIRGYDRLTAGFMGRAFLGYFYMSNNKLINLVCGIEWIQGQTHSVRGYNYDTQQADQGKRSDGYVGLKLGWVLHLYQRAPDKFYMN